MLKKDVEMFHKCKCVICKELRRLYGRDFRISDINELKDYVFGKTIVPPF